MRFLISPDKGIVVRAGLRTHGVSAIPVGAIWCRTRVEIDRSVSWVMTTEIGFAGGTQRGVVCGVNLRIPQRRSWRLIRRMDRRRLLPSVVRKFPSIND